MIPPTLWSFGRNCARGCDMCDKLERSDYKHRVMFHQQHLEEEFGISLLPLSFLGCMWNVVLVNNYTLQSEHTFSVVCVYDVIPGPHFNYEMPLTFHSFNTTSENWNLSQKNVDFSAFKCHYTKVWCTMKHNHNILRLQFHSMFRWHSDISCSLLILSFKQ